MVLVLVLFSTKDTHTFFILVLISFTLILLFFFPDQPDSMKKSDSFGCNTFSSICGEALYNATLWWFLCSDITNPFLLLQINT